MFTRRKLIKAGLLSLPAFQYAASAGAARSSPANSNGSGSPPTPPFVAELPIPPVAQPVTTPLSPTPDVNPVAGEATRAPHQRWNEFFPQKFYEIHEREAYHSFHPNLPASKIWGFDGIYPGPTFHARYGEPIVVRFRNELPPNHVGFGIPETTTHLHGGHIASESDGFPADFYASGLFKDNHYPNFFAGGDPREAQGTLHYHDHRQDFTTQNVYKGLNGFYLLFDTLDSGNENDTNPLALRLPSGDFDISLDFADKRFTPNGELFLNPFDLEGFLGDKFTVNGAIQPFLKVARRKYRFRLLNAGPSRFYEFFLMTGTGQSVPFTYYIANDGNLLPAPLPNRGSVRLSVAERADVIIDFSPYRIGDQIFVVNRLAQEDGTGPSGGLLNPGTPILRFDVDHDAADPSQVPSSLRPLPPIDLSQVVKTRRWIFGDDNGGWTINEKFFNVNEVRAAPRQGTAEIWVLQNDGDWGHPIHIHLVTFRILSRNGRPPAPHEAGRKDVVELRPDDNVKVFMRFQDFMGRYPAHCHNLVHEDHAMMFRWDVVP